VEVGREPLGLAGVHLGELQMVPGPEIFACLELSLGKIRMGAGKGQLPRRAPGRAGAGRRQQKIVHRMPAVGPRSGGSGASGKGHRGQRYPR